MAFFILRLSLATKFIFYAQTIDPDLALPFASQFDQIIIDSFSKLVDSAPTEFDENAIRQMQLPVKEGGCVQRANARVLSGDPTPGRRNPPPRSLLARGRDLALCGS